MMQRNDTFAEYLVMVSDSYFLTSFKEFIQFCHSLFSAMAISLQSFQKVPIKQLRLHSNQTKPSITHESNTKTSKETNFPSPNKINQRSRNNISSKIAEETQSKANK
jgi:hypothetical protein